MVRGKGTESLHAQLAGKQYRDGINEVLRATAVRPNDLDHKALSLLDALQECGRAEEACRHLRQALEGLGRDRISNWRAYLYTLLRQFDEGAYETVKAGRVEHRRRRGERRGEAEAEAGAQASARAGGLSEHAAEFVPGRPWAASATPPAPASAARELSRSAAEFVPGRAWLGGEAALPMLPAAEPLPLPPVAAAWAAAAAAAGAAAQARPPGLVWSRPRPPVAPVRAPAPAPTVRLGLHGVSAGRGRGGAVALGAARGRGAKGQGQVAEAVPRRPGPQPPAVPKPAPGPSAAPAASAAGHEGTASAPAPIAAAASETSAPPPALVGPEQPAEAGGGATAAVVDALSRDPECRHVLLGSRAAATAEGGKGVVEAPPGHLASSSPGHRRHAAPIALPVQPLSAAECAAVLHAAERQGLRPPGQAACKADGLSRIISADASLAELLWRRVKDHVPAVWAGRRVIGLSNRLCIQYGGQERLPEGVGAHLALRLCLGTGACPSGHTQLGEPEALAAATGGAGDSGCDDCASLHADVRYSDEESWLATLQESLGLGRSPAENRWRGRLLLLATAAGLLLPALSLARRRRP